MIGRTNVGGGAGLNFKVVGGTSAPDSPSENMIWVNTSTTITSWVFSVTEPESPSAGMVWISIGTASPAEFNALKKNTIHVYPLSAKQYIGGSWEDRTAKSYLGGVWSAWGQWLYNAGVWSNGSALTKTYTNQSHTLTYNAGDIRAICTSRHDAVYTAFALTEDLTAWNQLCVKFTANEAYTAAGTELGYAAVRLQAATGTHHNTGVAVKGQMNMAAGETYTLQLDISQLEGDHYIHLLFYNYGTDGSKVDVNIQEVWLQ